MSALQYKILVLDTFRSMSQYHKSKDGHVVSKDHVLRLASCVGKAYHISSLACIMNLAWGLGLLDSAQCMILTYGRQCCHQKHQQFLEQCMS